LADRSIQVYGGTADSSANEKPVWNDIVHYKDKYNYFITQENYDAVHSDPPQNFLVYLLEDVDDPYNMRVYGKYGQMMRDYHWRIVSTGTVEFLGFHLQSLKVGDNLWFAFYEPGQ